MKKAKLLLGATILTASLVLAGCTKEGETAYGNFEVKKVIDDSTYEVVDKETGIHYYFLNTGYGKALTPVIESDGSIRGVKSKEVVQEDKQKKLEEINNKIQELEQQKNNLE